MAFSIPEQPKAPPKAPRKRRTTKKKDTGEFKPPVYKQKRADGVTLPLPLYDLSILDERPTPLDEGSETNLPVTALCSYLERDYIRAACHIEELPTWEWCRSVLVKAAVEIVQEKQNELPTTSESTEKDKEEETSSKD